MDDDHRVLLFSGIDRTKPEMQPWWFAVGGALDRGESPEDAAIRETREETGLAIAHPGPVVMVRRFEWEFEGHAYDQEEHYFIVHTPAFEPDVDGWTIVEKATMRAHKWWSIDELRSTKETVFPEGLADLLERHRRQ